MELIRKAETNADILENAAENNYNGIKEEGLSLRAR